MTKKITGAEAVTSGWRLGKAITEFVASCEFERPFHVVCIDGSGRVVVARYALVGIEMVYDTADSEPRPEAISPLTVLAIPSSGGIKSTVIEVRTVETVQ